MFAETASPLFAKACTLFVRVSIRGSLQVSSSCDMTANMNARAFPWHLLRPFLGVSMVLKIVKVIVIVIVIVVVVVIIIAIIRIIIQSRGVGTICSKHLCFLSS